MFIHYIIAGFFKLTNRGFGKNRNAMLAARAFFGLWLMANALEGNNGNTLCATGSISRSVTKSSYIEPFHNILIVKSIQT